MKVNEETLKVNGESMKVNGETLKVNGESTKVNGKTLRETPSKLTISINFSLSFLTIYITEKE